MIFFLPIKQFYAASSYPKIVKDKIDVILYLWNVEALSSTNRTNELNVHPLEKPGTLIFFTYDMEIYAKWAEFSLTRLLNHEYICWLYVKEFLALT